MGGGTARVVAAGARVDDDEPLPSWAIQYQPSELERRLWEKRNVNIFDMTLDDFVVKMQQWMK